MGPGKFTCLATAVFVWLFSGCSAPSRVNEKHKSSAGSDDKIIAEMRDQGLHKPTPFYLTEINSNAMRSFVSSYPNATDPMWVKYPGGFVVYFIRNGIRHKVYYTRTGDQKCIIRQYSAEYMPAEIRLQVDSSFQGYRILLVNEVTRMSKTRYEIKIENESSIKEIKIDDIGIEVTNQFVRSQ